MFYKKLKRVIEVTSSSVQNFGVGTSNKRTLFFLSIYGRMLLFLCKGNMFSIIYNMIKNLKFVGQTFKSIYTLNNLVNL